MDKFEGHQLEILLPEIKDVVFKKMTRHLNAKWHIKAKVERVTNHEKICTSLWVTPGLKPCELVVTTWEVVYAVGISLQGNGNTDAKRLLVLLSFVASFFQEMLTYFVFQHHSEEQEKTFTKSYNILIYHPPKNSLLDGGRAARLGKWGGSNSERPPAAEGSCVSL